MHAYIDDRKVPQILALSASRVGEWSSHSWKWLTRLRTAVLKRVNTEKRLSCRTMRIEQRKAIFALLKVMLSHLDLKTMQVGIYNPETNVFTHLSLEYFAHKANLSLRRTQRAMAWLYEAGYVMGYRQSSFDITTNEYQHKPSIRKVTLTLMQDLGITNLALCKARDRARKNQNKLLIQEKRKNIQPTNEKKSFKSVIPIIENIASRWIAPRENIDAHAAREAYTEKIRKLMLNIPDLSLEEARKMLPKNSFAYK